MYANLMAAVAGEHARELRTVARRDRAAEVLHAAARLRRAESNVGPHSS